MRRANAYDEYPVDLTNRSASARWRWLLGLAGEDESGREHRNPVDQLRHPLHPIRIAWDTRHAGEVKWRRGAVAAVLAVIITTAVTAVLVLVEVASGFGTRLSALVGLHAATDGLGRDALADLDIGLFDNHPALDGLPAAAAVLGAEHPLPVGIGKLADRDDADTRLVIAAVTWPEADAPSGLGVC